MKRIKYIKHKSFFASHPLYDMASAICNPTGESSNVTEEYNGILFKLDSTHEDYFDEDGKKIRTVNVLGLNEPEERWYVTETTYEGNTHISKSPSGKSTWEYDDQGNMISYKCYDNKGKLMSVEKSECEYNDRGLLIKQVRNGKGEEYHYEYDEKDRVTCEKEYFRGILVWEFKKTYDEKGNLAREEQAFFGDDYLDKHQDTPIYTLINVFTREYNEDGKCVLEYLCCEDGMGPDELFTWEYQYWD